MAQLKEDEWPGDGEPTTSEQEGGAVKGEGAHPPRDGAGHPDDRPDGPPYRSIVNTVDPDRQAD